MAFITREANVSRDEALAVPCPRCGAHQTMHCWGMTRLRLQPHAERFYAAMKARKTLTPDA